VSTIANLPKVKEALDNLREVLETERRDRIEFLRICIGSWRADIERAEKLPERIARSEAEIAELETVSLPLSVTTLLGGAVRNCPLCLLPVMTSELSPRDGIIACRACRLNAEEYNKQLGVCPDCGKKAPREELSPAPCPFESEVNGNKTPFSMCNACRSARADDI